MTTSAKPGAGDKRLLALNAVQEQRRRDVVSRIEAAVLNKLQDSLGEATLRIEDIAEEAGISRRSFYRYFSSPEEVLLKVLCRMMDEWSEAVRARPVNEVLSKSFEAGNFAILQAQKRNSYFRLALRLISGSDQLLERVRGPIQAYVAESTKDIFAARLLANGIDVSVADALAAAHAAILLHLVAKASREGRSVKLGEVEKTIYALGVLARE